MSSAKWRLFCLGLNVLIGLFIDLMQALPLSPHQGEVLRNPLYVYGSAIKPWTHVSLLHVTIDENWTF